MSCEPGLGPFAVQRTELVRNLAETAAGNAVVVLHGPPGSGKTTLLLQVAASLERAGWRAVYLDLLGAASTPERFVRAALAALPAEGLGRHLARAVEIERLAAAGRLQGRAAVQALCDLLAELDEAAGRPLVLLLDEVGEVRSLAYFPGLRQAHELLGAALASRARGTLLATSFGTAARRLWDFELRSLTPLAPAELEPTLARLASASPDEFAALTCGWPRYVRLLAEACALTGQPPRAAWLGAMVQGGALERACQATYETLLLRSRGYGASKAVLAAVAHEPGLNLTALVARLGRTAGATRDYLQWLLGVDALERSGKRYFYVDRLLGAWVHLHARGTRPPRSDLEAAAAQLVRAHNSADRANPGAPAFPAPPAHEQPAPARRDAWIEID